MQVYFARKEGGTHVRKSLILTLLLGLPALAQVTSGNETVQDAIRFERQKDAADARQERIEARRAANSNADREDTAGAVTRSAKTKKSPAAKGSAARNKTTSQPQQ
jgi:hypothetical protein